MRPVDWLALAAVAVVAIGGELSGGGGETGERRPEPRRIAPEPPPAAAGPGFVVTLGDKPQSSTGTAFSIEGSGAWITARHVTDGCDAVALERRDGRVSRVRRVQAHTGADISVLRTAAGAPALPLAGRRAGGDGYSFGFPKGAPGDVHGRVIGHRRMLTRGRYRAEEPVVAWTHVRRVPDRGPYLGGISGGPWVNAAGEVVGVHVAGSTRRGRSYSTTPETLAQAIAAAGVRPAARAGDLPPASTLSPAGFAEYGDGLRRRESVAKVLCLVGARWRRGS